jgi:pimeloyl-ACP methyl ester carboxylesterase
MPDARFVAIPGCGHLPMEENPAALLAAIRPFLAEASRLAGLHTNNRP